MFPFLHLCEIYYVCIFVERQVPTDGFVYDHPKSIAIADSVGRLPFNLNCCGSIIYGLIYLGVSPCVHGLEAKRFVGSVMTVSRPKYARRAWPAWSISRLALIGKLGKIGEWI
jgi:hypothetical protein